MNIRSSNSYTPNMVLPTKLLPRSLWLVISHHITLNLFLFCGISSIYLCAFTHILSHTHSCFLSLIHTFLLSTRILFIPWFSGLIVSPCTFFSHALFHFVSTIFPPSDSMSHISSFASFVFILLPAPFENFSEIYLGISYHCPSA